MIVTKEADRERALLTDEDRREGMTIRFNLDGALRGTFKERQEGLNIQRQAGVISANEWRQHEGMNPISEKDGGDEYYRQGQSGQSATPPGGTPPTMNEPPANDDEREEGEDARNADR
jgi:hypothetical protein